MNLYIQYHNVANEGLLLSDPPFTATRRSRFGFIPFEFRSDLCERRQRFSWWLSVRLPSLYS